MLLMNSERAQLREACKVLAELLCLPEPRTEMGARAGGTEWDARVRSDKLDLLIDFRGRGDSATVSLAMLQIAERTPRLPRNGRALLAVPFMSKAAAGLCERHDQNWFDLAGNARIVLPGIRVVVEGKLQESKPLGRPENVFATKSERVTHVLMLPGNEAGLAQHELARRTGLGPGFVSRIVRRLHELGLVRRHSGVIQVVDRARMLDAWRDGHRFPRERVVAGVIPARTNIEYMRRLATEFERSGVRHAFTGLAAALQLAPFADFHLSTCYIEGEFTIEMRKKVAFLETVRGASTWIVPNADPGVFLGAREAGGFRTVGPLLTYLDLMHHPERAREAADHLRETDPIFNMAAAHEA